jgi:hypothetical protein
MTLKRSWTRVILQGALLLGPLLVAAFQETPDVPDMGGAPAEDDEYDERTLLDTFGEVAKEYLTQKVIPDTDVECKWDWRFVRCEPFCECEFVPKRGDYHLGRACRRQVKESCDPVESRPTSNPLQLVIQRTVRWSNKAAHSVAVKAKKGYDKVQANVCDELPEIDCSDEIPVIAWQQRLLCRDSIPECAFVPKSKRVPAKVVEQMRVSEANAVVVEETVEDTLEGIKSRGGEEMGETQDGDGVHHSDQVQDEDEDAEGEGEGEQVSAS